MKNYISLW